MSDVLKLTEDDINNPDILGKKLMTLAEIVVRKHFYASLAEKEDLVSVGVLKAISLINKGEWSKNRGSFVNYIYSGMRNDIHNYLYHQNKFSYVDPESLPETGRDDLYFEDCGCDMEYSIIHSVCMNFIDSFGDAIEHRVIEELTELGYNIKGMRNDSHTLMQCNLVLDEFGEDIESDVISRLIGLILWKKKELDH